MTTQQIAITRLTRSSEGTNKKPHTFNASEFTPKNTLNQIKKSATQYPKNKRLNTQDFASFFLKLSTPKISDFFPKLFLHKKRPFPSKGMA